MRVSDFRDHEIYSGLKAIPPIVIRVDGRSFRNVLQKNGFKKPFDEVIDAENLIKIEKANLPTVSFANPEKIKLGKRVFLVGMNVDKKVGKKLVNQGVVRHLDKNSIQTNIFEKNSLKGSPLFDIEGNLLGLTFIDYENRISAVPISVIHDFIGF